jgi:putative transposase
MSRKANCLDHAWAETLFGSLKVERLHGQSFQTIREAKDEVIAWLLWYNRTRMHSTPGLPGFDGFLAAESCLNWIDG